jgi:hypothetical protein
MFYNIYRKKKTAWTAVVGSLFIMATLYILWRRNNFEIFILVPTFFMRCSGLPVIVTFAILAWVADRNKGTIAVDAFGFRRFNWLIHL